MREKVKFVTLSREQVEKAKKANGERKQITHAVVCGHYGQIFGTEKFCRKYYSAWSQIFPHLFSGGEEVENMDFSSFKSTPDLVMVLINAHDPLEKAAQQKMLDGAASQRANNAQNRSWLSVLRGLMR